VDSAETYSCYCADFCLKSSKIVGDLAQELTTLPGPLVDEGSRRTKYVERKGGDGKEPAELWNCFIGFNGV